MEEVIPEADIAICFGATASDARSLINNAYQMGRFKVWAWRTPQLQSVRANVFDGTVVSYDVTYSDWTYSPVQSWILDNEYDFYALYPDTLSALKGFLPFAHSGILRNWSLVQLFLDPEVAD